MDEAGPSGQQVPVRLLGPILSPEGRVQAQTMSQPHLLGKALTPASTTQAAAEYQGHGHRLLPLSGAPVPLLQSHRAVKSTNLSIFTVLMAPGHPWVGEGWQQAGSSWGCGSCPCLSFPICGGKRPRPWNRKLYTLQKSSVHSSKAASG